MDTCEWPRPEKNWFQIHCNDKHSSLLAYNANDIKWHFEEKVNDQRRTQ
jgi:hypothetical protein